MFPKGQQKKKDTVVVMVDGKSPQTIPTMDSPPEPQKIPKCRLLVILTIILILALVLLAGYCAWLFFSYETDILPFKQSYGPDSMVRPTELSEDDDHVTTAPSKIKDDIFSRAPPVDDSNIFYFSDSSVESVYDSSEPYGSSQWPFSSWSRSEDVFSSHESDSLSSLTETTVKGDKYLWNNPRNRPTSGWDRLKEFLNRARERGDYSSGDGDLTYDVMSSYWVETWDGNELPFDDDVNDDSFSSWPESSRFSSDYVDPYVEVDSSELKSSWVSEYNADFYSELDDDDYSWDWGSGSPSSYFDVPDDSRDFIPQHVTAPPFIDRLPPERIEVFVCTWPSRIFEKSNTRELTEQVSSIQDRLFCIYDDSFSFTILSNNDGTAVIRTILADYKNSILAVKIENSTEGLPSSECYISYFPDAPESDENYSDYSGDDEIWDDEMEGSGTLDEVDSIGQTVVIRNPVLLGRNMNMMMSSQISSYCSTSKNFWATSITVKTKPR